MELETGLHEAYFGFPFLVGHVGVDNYVKGPLVLFPISIEYRKFGKPSGWYLVFSGEKTVIVNRALMALLKKKGRIAVSDSFYERFEDIIEQTSSFGEKKELSGAAVKDNEKIDKSNGQLSIENYFIQNIVNLLIDNGFPASILENKLDKIEILEPLSREQQSVLPKEELHLVNYKIIGHFPQGDSAIYTDYEELMKRAESGETNQGIIDNLLEIPSPEDSWSTGDGENDIGGDIDLDTIPAESLNLVLESDASQEAVIVAAESAECTVVRGPPGTGKSQAIVNLIANALGKQKKVLLVCQKRAALDVVYQRLDKVGLSQYIALLHDATNDRRELYRQLSKLLSYGTASSHPSSQSIDSQIDNVSKTINRLVTVQKSIVVALSKKYFGGVTAHYLYAHAQPGYVRKLDLSYICTKVNYYQLKELVFTVGGMETDARKFDDPNYLWYERNSFSDLTLEDKVKIQARLDEVIRSIKSDIILVLADTSKQTELITSLKILSSTADVFDKIKLPLTKGNETAKRFVNDPRFLTANSDILGPLVAGADQGLEFWNSLKKLRNFISGEVFTKPTNVFTENRSLETDKLLGILDEINNNANDNILITLPDTTRQSEIIDSLEILSTTKGMFRSRKSSVRKANETVQRLINSEEFLSIDSTIRDTIQLSVQKAHETVKRLIGDGRFQFDPVIMEKLETGATQGLEFWNSLKKLRNFLNEDGFEKLTTYITASTLEKSQFIEKLENMKKTIENDFEQIQAHEGRSDSLSDTENLIFKECKTKIINEVGWTKILEQEFYIHWIQSIEQQNPVLRNQPFETYTNNRNLLSSEVKKHRELSRINISKKIENGIIRPVSTNTRAISSKNNSGASMWNNLNNDLEKKRRVLPVRKLVEKYSQILFNVAPCWLASPEAVASVFPLIRNLFDFIIFDEASQSAVERSLTSVYRGHHIVVMGDEKQLRPFDLFSMNDEEEEEADDDLIDETLLSESLLVLAKRTYGYRYLVWHYRSKYQELINFSNHAFYDGHLQVAPNIVRTPEPAPIHWVKCENGVWANRQNLREAYAVVNVIENLLIQDEDQEFRSIGVITFNDSQRTAILDEIDRRRKSDPTFDELYTAAENPQSKNLDDIPFIKNIENVQGDERDIIIFSVGYAKDVEGKVRLRFGTLNQEGGENRLNVAISRARQEIIVVSSLEPDELHTDTAKNNGPRRFKDYLHYAKYISEGRNENVKNVLESLNPGFAKNVNLSGKSGDNTLVLERPFEEIVYDRLLTLGYQIVTQVGYSGYKIDLAIVHPDDPSKYILGIECDGTMFQSAKSTRERDVMRQEFLQSRGWNIERIWSTNWWRNPQNEIERIRQKIESLRVEGDTNNKRK